ncbi:MAG TPA: 3-hydroxyacyl-ACP dehydratase FabZ family protein [Flavobacterium sp.]|jgi:3-hydroxyacyl-[acyl-carrier-protein] dehydratase
MDYEHIKSQLPYLSPFLFVDELQHIDENGVTGSFTFDESMDFYRGHFVNNPITPGVILTEVMAQTGLVCLGIYLTDGNISSGIVALTSVNIEFMKPVFPGEKVMIYSEKIYFRFNKLKCRVRMENSQGLEICNGEIAGIIK